MIENTNQYKSQSERHKETDCFPKQTWRRRQNLQAAEEIKYSTSSYTHQSSGWEANCSEVLCYQPLYKAASATIVSLFISVSSLQGRCGLKSVFLPWLQLWVCALQSFGGGYTHETTCTQQKWWREKKVIFIQSSCFSWCPHSTRWLFFKKQTTGQVRLRLNRLYRLQEQNSTSLSTQRVSAHSSAHSAWMLSYTITFSSNETKIQTKNQAVKSVQYR